MNRLLLFTILAICCACQSPASTREDPTRAGTEPQSSEPAEDTSANAQSADPGQQQEPAAAGPQKSGSENPHGIEREQGGLTVRRAASMAARAGCHDSDGDGILDSFDRCADEAEVFNGVDDSDGCADEPASFVSYVAPVGEPVASRGCLPGAGLGQIEFVQPIRMNTWDDSDRIHGCNAHILPESEPVLDHLAALLKAIPGLTQISIEGHSNSLGVDRFSCKPTDSWAEETRDALVARGIDYARLRTVGYGEDCPIDTNKTAEGRENNLRIQLRILERTCF